jgi:flagellar hook-associated protein 3 FlgL
MSNSIGAGSYGTLDRMLASAGTLRDQYATLQEQTVTGQVSQSYAGLASVSSRVLDLTAATNQNAAYTQVIASAQGKASVMQDALSQLGTMVSKMASGALGVTGSASTAAVTGMAEQARQALTQMASLLNTTFGGDYVFAGADASNPPVPSPGSVTPSSAAAGTIFSASFNAAPPVDVHIGASESVSLGLGADKSALNDIVQTLAVMANSTSPSSAGFADSMQAAATKLTAAGASLAQEGEQIGLTQNTMTSATASHAATQTLLTNQFSDLTNVDMATAISHMQAVNSQLQASYKVLGEMSSLNLASFL